MRARTRGAPDARRRLAERVGGFAAGASVAMCAALAAGCAPRSPPDPRVAARAFAQASKQGDADALYAMMSNAARQAHSREEVRKIVAEQRDELRDQGAAFEAKDTTVRAVATLRFDDGEDAFLDLYGGRYWVTAAGTLPGGSKSPEQALDQLRRVLARRSYAGLMRVLSPSTRRAIEHDLGSLVVGLERPETLDVRVTGDAATVTVPGGHTVRLKREGSLWRVDDFD